MKYDEKKCLAILKKHGWKPVLLQGHQLSKDWTLMALTLALLDKNDG